jgi:hypothetical protein
VQCVRSLIVTNWSDLLLSLVPQRDRRQQPERRKLPRGSRRATDVALADDLAETDDSILWTTTPVESARIKPSFH